MAVEHVHDRLNGVELELLVALELDFHVVDTLKRIGPLRFSLPGKLLPHLAVILARHGRPSRPGIGPIRNVEGLEVFSRGLHIKLHLCRVGLKLRSKRLRHASGHRVHSHQYCRLAANPVINHRRQSIDALLASADMVSKSSPDVGILLNADTPQGPEFTSVL